MLSKESPATSAHIISLDDEAAWPQSLIKLLDEQLPNLRAYEIERARIDKLAEDDVMLRIDPPDNPYLHIRDEVLAEVKIHIQPCLLVGYHCTRLHNDEIFSIKSHGMQLPSLETLISRIRERELNQDIPPHVATRLIDENQAGDYNRAQMLWFIFSLALLERSGVADLFRFWGGEALYNSHAEDVITGAVLETVGTPCIIKAAVPIKEIKRDVREFFLRGYLHRRSVSTSHDPNMDGSITTSLGPEYIQQIIQMSDPEFTQLIHFSL